MDELVERARGFIYRNARLLERQLFAFHFEGAPADGVIRALRAYQNADGGFGNALEPDKRTPASQPQDVEFAFHVLDQVGVMPPEIVVPALDWLATVMVEGGVPFSLATVNGYPHMPWWGVGDATPPDINPTGPIAGLALKHGVQHPWLDVAEPFCFAAVEASESMMFHELICAAGFLEHARDRSRAEPLLARVLERAARPGVVALDPAATGYVQKPLDWAPTPASVFRPLFDDATIDRHLAWLASLQEDDGGWPMNWEPLSEGVRLEWRGWVTLRALLTLRAYRASL